MLTQTLPIAGVARRIGRAVTHGLKRAGRHVLGKASNWQSAANRSGWRNAGKQERRRRADCPARSEARPYVQARRNLRSWPPANPVSPGQPVIFGRRSRAGQAITMISGRNHGLSSSTCLARRCTGGELRALTRQSRTDSLLALGNAYRKVEAIAARGMLSPLMQIPDFRIVGLRRRRPGTPEERDLVLLRNAELQIMLSELHYPPIHYL